VSYCDAEGKGPARQEGHGENICAHTRFLIYRLGGRRDLIFRGFTGKKRCPCGDFGSRSPVAKDADVQIRRVASEEKAIALHSFDASGEEGGAPSGCMRRQRQAWRGVEDAKLSDSKNEQDGTPEIAFNRGGGFPGYGKRKLYEFPPEKTFPSVEKTPRQSDWRGGLEDTLGDEKRLSQERRGGGGGGGLFTRSRMVTCVGILDTAAHSAALLDTVHLTS